MLDQLILYTDLSLTEETKVSINQENKKKINIKFWNDIPVYKNVRLVEDLIQTEPSEKLKVIHNELIDLRKKLNGKE